MAVRVSCQLVALTQQHPTKGHAAASGWLVNHVDMLGGATGDVGDGRGEGGGFRGEFVGGAEIASDDGDEDRAGVEVGVAVLGVLGGGEGAEADPGAVGLGSEDGAGGIGEAAGEAFGRWGAVADEVDVEDRHGGARA